MRGSKSRDGASEAPVTLDGGDRAVLMASMRRSSDGSEHPWRAAIALERGWLAALVAGLIAGDD